MASSSSTTIRKERKEVLNVQLVINEVRKSPFWVIPKMIYKEDPFGALSMIPPQVLMIQDVRCCYTCKVSSIGEMEIRDLYGKLCVDGVLKEENKIIERKGLTHALDFPNVFRIE